MNEAINFRSILDPQDDAWIKIYLEAFPPEERRNIEDIKRLIVEEERFKMEYILYGGTKVGFIIYWQLSDTLFAEHFAMDQGVRGQGWGGRALGMFLQRIAHTPMIIEVEPPTDVLARRRIAFYEAFGFRLWQTPYYQPPYRTSEEPLPLKLMSYNVESEPSVAWIEELYHVVYGYSSDRW